ncbi:MAG TPA: transketolase [Alphaproteobacteria bacterium]|nr:transketolase [Alphaproteobacteria bacterium]
MTSKTAAAPDAQIQDLTEPQLKSMANAIRALSMDAVQKANSGHPGAPMGLADVATVLYSKFLKFDPKNPEWPDRDRFVLSGGHASMLLYSLNYLTGYEKMTLEQIKNFRQMGAITAGHPEVEQDAGIETTTGPLGQGIATAVGMALAERILNGRYGDDLVDHYTYVMCGDGDLMEGISHEACSLAGHQKLEKLIVLYDDNNICIDGTVDLTFIDDTPKRFEAYGWDVQTVDGHDFVEIEAAIAKAKTTDTPSLICCKTHIGFGAPTKQDSNKAHGALLGEDEIKGAREKLDWPHAPFEVPDKILANWRAIGAKGKALSHDWKNRLNSHEQKDAFMGAMTLDLAPALAPLIAKLKSDFATEKPKKATRQLSGMVLEALVPAIDSLVGGSADLTGSNNTKVAASKVINKEDYSGNYINYGVREFGMAACMNGLTLHGGFVPYAGTFLQFADYSRAAIRLGALMKQRVIHVMTHDSIGLGEDGPTHQPVEHVAALRAIPNVYVFRPCDGIETAESWELAINKKDAPSVLALTRQSLPTLCEYRDENMVARGAYILRDCDGEPEVTIFASGSEVMLAVEAAEKISAGVRVVSVPCMDLFYENAQKDSADFVKLVCNKSIKIGVEAGIRQGWDRIIGAHSYFIGMDSFGASAPADELYEHFGITTEAIVEAANTKLAQK